MADTGDSSRSSRTLVLCFDGTSNEYDADNTNVVKLFSLLKKDDFEEQLCYYRAGVGTWFQPGVVSPMFEWIAKILDLAVAWYLDAHVMDGYKFLMNNYRVGDKICLFGFSRGAYTARALGGFLYKVGLLPRGNEAQVPFAYKMYTRTDEAGLKLCKGFKETYCQDVSIEFMGVWDTVSSVGVIMGRTLPFTNSNSSVRTFRHALSLDEHRSKFRPNLYHRPSPTPEAAKHDPNHASPVPNPALPTDAGLSESAVQATTSSVLVEQAPQNLSKRKTWGFHGRTPSPTGKKVGRKFVPYASPVGPTDDVLEVWFAGCHTDIGGGSVNNDDPKSLANITLRWMVREIMASTCEIKFDVDALAKVKIDLSPEPSEAEIELDSADAVEPGHDELKLNVIWWLLEIIPLTYRWQDAQGVWHREWNIHFGRGRDVVDLEPKFHTSVKQRMQSALKYTPKAVWKKGTEVYVQ